MGPKPYMTGAAMRETPGPPTGKRHSKEVAEDRASEKANLAGTLVLALCFRGERLVVDANPRVCYGRPYTSNAATSGVAGWCHSSKSSHLARTAS